MKQKLIGNPNIYRKALIYIYQYHKDFYFSQTTWLKVHSTLSI
jgi:hypothetical protein